MAVSLREYRARIKSTGSMKKITRAMELIAASRIIKAQQRAQQAAPYARELTRAVSALATYSDVDHPLTTEPENPTKAAILIITSDRGLAGAYSSAVLKEGERLAERLRGEGKKITTFISGRKGEGYFRFRQRPIRQSWNGFSDQPQYENAREIGEALIEAFIDDGDEGVDEPPARGHLRVGVLDALHRLVVQTEVMADLVDDGLAHELRHLLLVVAVFLDRALVDRDRVGEHVAVAGVAVREIDAPVEPVECVGRLDPEVGERLVVRPVLDDDGDVRELVLELPGQAT